MNDLAEKALHGLDAARRGVAAHPVPALGLAGFVAAAVVVVTGGRIGAAPAAVPLSHWLGLLPAAGYQVTNVAMGLVMLAAIGVLIALWLLAMHVSRVRSFTARQVSALAVAWAAPFAIGPPLLTTDIYRAAAAGELARRGRSPYHQAPYALGPQRLVDAIDPSWRSAHSTDGPLALVLSHLVVSLSAGSALVAVIVLRAVAVLSVIALGRVAGDIAGGRRSSALCLTVLNPATLLFVVSAGQFTGLVATLLIASTLLAGQRRWTRAVVCACLAAGLKPVALVALPALVLVHLLGRPAGQRVRVAARDLLVAALALVLIVFSVPFGLGWIANLGTATRAHLPFAPASAVGNLVGLIVSAASYDDLLIGGRVAAGAAGCTVLLYLYATARTRPLERTIGYALLTAGLLAPVVYPSYLLLGVLCLAPSATGLRRDWVVALSCAACVLTPVGLGEHGGEYATAIALTVIAIGLYLQYRLQRRVPLLRRTQVRAAG
jgi:alpha-1,6-mannosyltransferase